MWVTETRWRWGSWEEKYRERDITKTAQGNCCLYIVNQKYQQWSSHVSALPHPPNFFHWEGVRLLLSGSTLSVASWKTVDVSECFRAFPKCDGLWVTGKVTVHASLELFAVCTLVCWYVLGECLWQLELPPNSYMYLENINCLMIFDHKDAIRNNFNSFQRSTK